MTYLQTAIDFTVHQVERSEEGTAHVQKNAVKFGGNCKKIMQHFQKQNIPLSDDYARQLLGVRNLAQRCADLRNIPDAGIEILTRWDDTKTFKLYYLGCTCHEPRRDTKGCWLHSQELQIK